MYTYMYTRIYIHMYVYNGLVILISSLNESYMIRDTSLFIRKVISLNKRYTYESTLAFLFIFITPYDIFFYPSYFVLSEKNIRILRVIEFLFLSVPSMCNQSLLPLLHSWVKMRPSFSRKNSHGRAYVCISSNEFDDSLVGYMPIDLRETR